MNEYQSRSEIAPVDRVTRKVAAVPSVPAATPVNADTQAAVSQAPAAPTPADNAVNLAAGSEEQLASAAEYARVHASIADILAGLRAGQSSNTQTNDEAESAITALLPQPVIIVPLPPASKEMVERAVMLAKAMADQAQVTRSAQAHLKPGTVDQILATAA
ncbi:hypothetical protein KFK14_23235 [Sphingobium phenoxybenzoativorans]|uniref:Uncharacterized protein n=1 Tax=Sphingobium phenoxybenzoativorans TaxID=1592790 RepID=A0A975K9A2_9SPHN|nr:hypothetical protein [Sphingobium phenoxybenzoativorans]QUT05812.1 hypothetical protein KFK14_23235 [Sphingobium phenoxybenzoativorans]